MPLPKNLVQQQQHLQLHHELLYTTPILSLFTMKCCSFKGTVAGLLLHCCLTPGPGYKRRWGQPKVGGAGWEEARSTGMGEKDPPVEERRAVGHGLLEHAEGGVWEERRASGCRSSERRWEKGTCARS
jgi:hypothetical protein